MDVRVPDATPDQGRAYLVKEEHCLLEVSFRWQDTTLEMGHFAFGSTVTVGQHELCHFSLASEVMGQVPQYPLLVGHGKETQLFVVDGFEGWLQEPGGEVQTLDDWKRRGIPTRKAGLNGVLIPWTLGMCGVLKVDEWRIHLRDVPKEILSSARGKQAFGDWMFVRMTSLAAMVHVAFIVAFQFVPMEPHQLADKLGPGRGLSQTLTAPTPVKQRLRPKFRLQPPPPPRKNLTDTRQRTNQPKQISTVTRPMKEQGLLGLLSNGGFGGGGGRLFGKLQQSAFLGKLLGGASTGNFALADTGRGMRGRCGDTPCGPGLYGGGGRWGAPFGKRHYRRRRMQIAGAKKTRTIVRVKVRVCKIQGGLTRRQVAKVVKMYWAQILHCYERNLRNTPNLAGKVVLRWKIGPEGRVTSVSVAQTTMNHERTEGCLMRRVSRWRFPKPEGGTNVTIRYPFVFRTTR